MAQHFYLLKGKRVAEWVTSLSPTDLLEQNSKWKQVTLKGLKELGGGQQEEEVEGLGHPHSMLIPCLFHA